METGAKCIYCNAMFGVLEPHLPRQVHYGSLEPRCVSGFHGSRTWVWQPWLHSIQDEEPNRTSHRGHTCSLKPTKLAN